MKNIRAKIYEEASESCCIAIASQCRSCKEKDSCLILREQLSFYNRLGISQIDDAIDSKSLNSIKHLWKDSVRTKRYDPSWNYSEDNTRAYTHAIHPYPAMMIPQVAGRLIDMYAKPKAVMLDPVCCIVL